MATQATHPHYALTTTRLQQLEKWIGIAKDLNISDLSKAFPAIVHQVFLLSTYDICGTQEYQFSVLERLRTARKNLKRLGFYLDATITKRIENLAKGAGVKGVAMVDPKYSESPHPTPRVHRFLISKIAVGQEQYTDVTLLLDEQEGCLHPYEGVTLLAAHGGIFTIHFNLISMIFKTEGAKKIEVRLFWDRDVKLEPYVDMHGHHGGQELVRTLEAFSGLKSLNTSRSDFPEDATIPLMHR